jgi:hypothetical protein
VIARETTMYAKTLLPLLAFLLCGFADAAHAAASRLAPGVLVDADAGRAFVTDPAGFAQAISLADGRSAWISREPAVPLLESGGRLFALGRIEARGVGLLLLLDPATGEVLDRVAFDVPEHVAASLVPRPKVRFGIEAHPTAQGARVYWREVALPLRGAYLGDGSDAERITEGAFDLLLDAQRNLALPLREPAAPPAAPSVDLAPAERLPALGERQFRGLDDASAMASAPVADPVFGARWQWTLRARGARNAVAGPALPYAWLPFALLGETLLYRTEPVAGGADGRVVGHGARLVAWDLARGAERWHVDVLDPVYRGPMPP